MSNIGCGSTTMRAAVLSSLFATCALWGSGCGGVPDASRGEVDSIEVRAAEAVNPVVARITADSGEYGLTLVAAPVSLTTTVLRDADQEYDVIENRHEEEDPPSDAIKNLWPDPYHYWHNTPRHTFLRVRTGCLEGHARCLAILGHGWGGADTFPYDESEWSNDRLEINLSRQEDAGLKFSQPRYLRFYVKFGADFVLPQDPTLQADSDFQKLWLKQNPNNDWEFIIAQVWQRSSTAYGARGDKGPAFAIYVQPDPTSTEYVHLSFRTRNDSTVDTSVNGANEFYRVAVRKGQWNNFHVLLQPSWSRAVPGWQVARAAGSILVWMNEGANNPNLTAANARNTPARGWQSSFYWGFEPEPNWQNDPYHLLGDAFDIRVGMYRAIPSTHAPLYLDNLKVTTGPEAMVGL